MDELVSWLESELGTRGWRPADLARAAELPDATISRILNGISKAGPEVCNAIAQALKVPPEKVFRLAGMLPPLLASEDDPTFIELMDIAKNMSHENRQDLLKYARYRYQEEQDQKRRK